MKYSKSKSGEVPFEVPLSISMDEILKSGSIVEHFDEEFPRMAVIIFPHHEGEMLDQDTSSGDLELATTGIFTAPKTGKYKIGFDNLMKVEDVSSDYPEPKDGKFSPPKPDQTLTTEGWVDAVVHETPPMDNNLMSQGYVAIPKTKGERNIYDIMTISTLTTSDDDTPKHLKGTVLEEDKNYYYVLENKPTQLFSFKNFNEAFTYLVKRESGYIRKLDTMLSKKFNFEYVDTNCHHIHNCNTDLLRHYILPIYWVKQSDGGHCKDMWINSLYNYCYDILQIRKNVQIDEKTGDSTDIYEYFIYPLKENKYV